jgi:hypothetical protein
VPGPKIADTRPGMLRSLDFTPSTDQGQKYMEYLARMPNDRASENIGYAPIYKSVAHLNNP